MAQDTVDFADKDKTQPNTDPRKLIRDVDVNELKAVINANAADVTSALSNLINGAPGAYDTFGEIATAITSLLSSIGTLTSGIAAAQSNIDTHEALTNNPHSVTKSQVGLSAVDNTTDADKPISNLTQTALNTKTTTTNFAKGIAVVGTLNGSNTVFTIAQTIVSGSEDVFVNGLRMTDGEDYGMTFPGGVATITFTIAPQTDDLIRVNYIRP